MAAYPVDNAKPARGADLDELKGRLAESISDLTAYLTGKTPVPYGRDEVRFGSRGGISVMVSGPKMGIWHDKRDDVGGDAFRLIEHQRKCSFPEAVRFAREWLGDSLSEPWQPKPAPAPDPEEQARRAAAPAGMWARAGRFDGSPAQIAMQARGIEILPPDKVVRYLPNAWGNGRFGAMLVRADDASGALQAVQSVYVGLNGERPTVEDLGDFTAPDGTVIAPATRKRSRGNLKGSAMRLPARNGDRRLIVGEGPENGLSAWQAVGCEVWTVLGSLANLTHLALPVDRPVIIARDGDKPGSPADRALHKGAAALVAKGVDLYITTPPVGEDLNDALQAGGDAAVRAQIDTARPYCPPTDGGTRAPGMSAAEASTKLREVVAGFMGEALAWQPDAHLYDDAPEPFGMDEDDAPAPMGTPGIAPIVGIKAPAGLGKTEALLVEIIERTPEGHRTDFYMPEHRLGDELVQRCREIAHRVGRTDLSFTVERGRNRVLPDGTPMCRKADLAEEVSRLGRPVFSSLCRRKAKDGHPEERCEHYDTCPYIAQMHDQSDGIRFRPHAYLTIKQREDSRQPDMVAVDESFWQSTLRGDDRRSFIVTERLSAYREVPAKSKTPGRYDDNATADLHAIAGRALAVFQAKPAPGAADFLDAGVTAGDCRHAMALEYRTVEAFAVSPSMPATAQRQVIAAAKASEANKMARFWRLLAAEIENGREPLRSIVARRDVLNRNGDPENRLYLRWSAELRTPNVPMLLLDADMDPEIARRFLPAMRDPVVIEARRQNVEIVQITDRPVSMRMLCSVPTEKRTPPAEDMQRAANRRRDLRAFLEIRGDEAVRAGRPPGLAVTYLDAEMAMLADGEVTGCDLAHFGAIRGKDQWRDASFVVVAGRPQPGVDDLEWQTAALFHRDPRPLQMLEPETEGAGTRYLSERERFTMPDPSQAVPVAVDMHPDPLCMAVLRQIRECEITQALDRARLIHRTAGNPCTVFLLTSTPLPGVRVDRVTTWDELMPSKWERAFVRHGVLPLAPAAQAAAFPDLWPTEKAAKRAAERAREIGPETPIVILLGKRGLFSGAYLPSGKRPEGSQQAAAREVAYRLPRARGRPSRALVRSDIEDPREALELLVGPVASFELVADGAGEEAGSPAPTRYTGPTATSLEPDRDQMRRQMGYWFEGMRDGQVELGWTSLQTGAIDHTRRFDLDDLDGLADFAADVNRTAGQSVYFRPALLRPNGGGFERATGIWADLDAPGAAENARNVSPIIRPNMVVVTGHLPHLRAQLFWRLSDPIMGAETVEGLNGRAGALYRGDAQVFPAVNFMRLAGTIAWPWKDGRRIELTELHLFEDRPRSYPLLALARTLPDSQASPVPEVIDPDVDHVLPDELRTAGYWMAPSGPGFVVGSPLRNLGRRFGTAAEAIAAAHEDMAPAHPAGGWRQ